MSAAPISRTRLVDFLLCLLASISVGLGAYSLQKITTLGEMMAAGIERDSSNSREIADVRDRQKAQVSDVNALQSRVTALEAVRGMSRP